MKRILVFGMTENPGGVESFLLNYYRHIDREKLQFDFLCNTHAQVAYEDELKALGARVFHITPRRESRGRFYRELNALLGEKAGEWDALWVNVSSLANIDYLIAAKRAGIRKRIIHSHNSGNMEGILRRILHEGNKRRIRRWATDFWACSAEAAEWFYPGPLRAEAVIIRNAIDLEAKRFDPEKRAEVRKQLGWEDNRIIGNVGRLHFQKNQAFLLDVFAKVHAADPRSRLVLVGQGEDGEQLRAKAATLVPGDAVFFAGVQADVQAWLSAFDLFCFPSVFEGLSIAALEAQANGLPVLASDSAMPDELRINGNVRTLSLAEDSGRWAETILRMDGTGREDPDKIRERFTDRGYNILTETARLEELLTRP